MFDPVDTEKLSKGLHAFHIAPGQQARKLPEDYISDYLDAFLEEAYEHEYSEERHQAPRLEGGDPYMHLARAVYNELLSFAVHNPNLLRAISKFKIRDPKFVLERLEALGLCRVNSANYDAEASARVGGYHPEKVEPLAQQSPVHSGAYKSMDATFAQLERDQIDRNIRGGKQLAPGPEMVRLAAGDDPMVLLKKAHDSRPDPFDRSYIQSGAAEATVDKDCAIHGKDLTKSMNLANTFAHCTCPNPPRS